MNDLPKRKPLRLENYDYSSNGAYFVTICVKQMKCILSRITNVGSDAHIAPSIADSPVGSDAHIAPGVADNPVGSDAHIAPCVADSPVGSDAHIAPKLTLTKYGKICEKYLKRIPGIDTYVIMPNHIHLIVIKEFGLTVGDDGNVVSHNPHDASGAMKASRPTNLSADIRSFKIMATKEIGKSLWQTSYYDHIIRNEEDYALHLQYIEENPKKWLLGKDEYYA